VIKSLFEIAQTVYPKRIEESQVRVFISKYESGLYDDKTLKQAWQERVEEHVEYWRARYGLDDVHKCVLKPGPIVIKANWETKEDKIYSQIKVLTQPILNMVSPDIETFVETLLAIGYANGIGKHTLNNLQATGSIELFGEAVPSHDWEIWRKRMAELYGVSPRTISIHEMDYRRNPNSLIKTLEDLEELVEAKGISVCN
jgi:hypothetical protein